MKTAKTKKSTDHTYNPYMTRRKHHSMLELENAGGHGGEHVGDSFEKLDFSKMCEEAKAVAAALSSAGSGLQTTKVPEPTGAPPAGSIRSRVLDSIIVVEAEVHGAPSAAANVDSAGSLQPGGYGQGHQMPSPGQASNNALCTTSDIIQTQKVQAPPATNVMQKTKGNTPSANLRDTPGRMAAGSTKRQRKQQIVIPPESSNDDEYDDPIATSTQCRMHNPPTT